MIGDFSTRINQDIKFIDITTWKVYEHYTINREIKFNQLGFLSSVYQYRTIIKSTFLERRGNFQGRVASLEQQSLVVNEQDPYENDHRNVLRI